MDICLIEDQIPGRKGHDIPLIEGEFLRNLPYPFITIGHKQLIAKALTKSMHHMKLLRIRTAGERKTDSLPLPCSLLQTA